MNVDRPVFTLAGSVVLPRTALATDRPPAS